MNNELIFQCENENIEEVRRLLKEEADVNCNPLYVLHKGKSLYLLGEYEEALALLNKAINMKETAAHYYERGIIFKALGRN